MKVPDSQMSVMPHESNVPRGASRARDAGESTRGVDYARRLERLETARWKRLLDVQRPYRMHIQRLRLGRTLDVGCGTGRNLAYLSSESVGIDHNPHSIDLARQRGLHALTTDEFVAQHEQYPRASFDSMLAAHFIEHMQTDQAVEILNSYLPYLKPGARCVFITPQEKGYATDPTHVQFIDHAGLGEVARQLDLAVERQYSFPFLRPIGRYFPYNEFIQIARFRG